MFRQGHISGLWACGVTRLKIHDTWVFQELLFTAMLYHLRSVEAIYGVGLRPSPVYAAFYHVIPHEFIFICLEDGPTPVFPHNDL